MAGVAAVSKSAVVVVVFKMAGDTVFVSIDKYLGFMAIGAFDIPVLAEQWKLRQIVVEIRGVLPNSLIVTISALVALCSFVDVVFEMAGRTGRAWGGLEYWFNMTVDAGNVSVRPIQCEFCVARVIEDAIGPGLIRMTRPAICAVMAFVFVVFEVATDTRHVHFIVEWIVGVTIVTG